MNQLNYSSKLLGRAQIFLTHTGVWWHVDHIFVATTVTENVTANVTENLTANVKTQMLSGTPWNCCWESGDSKDCDHFLFLKRKKNQQEKGCVLKTWGQAGDLQRWEPEAVLSPGPFSKCSGQWKAVLLCLSMLPQPDSHSIFLFLSQNIPVSSTWI